MRGLGAGMPVREDGFGAAAELRREPGVGVGGSLSVSLTIIAHAPRADDQAGTSAMGAHPSRAEAPNGCGSHFDTWHSLYHLYRLRVRCTLNMIHNQSSLVPPLCFASTTRTARVVHTSEPRRAGA